MNYESTLRELALKDERIVVMTAENRAPVRGLPQVLGERFIDTGITEQTMIGMAAGLALRGRIPVVHALTCFLVLRAFEFIRTDVGLGGLPVKLVGWVPGFLSDGNGPTHQAIDDIAVLRSIPGMGLFCPADMDDLVAGLPEVIASPNPFYIRCNPRNAAITHAPFALGKAESWGEGRDVALLTYGTLLTEALDAKARLEKAGLGVKLVNLRTLRPLDEATVLDAVRYTRLTVTLEDHFLTGGLFTLLSELLVRNRIAPEVLPLGLETWFRPALLPDVLEHEGFTGEKIARKIQARMEKL